MLCCFWIRGIRGLGAAIGLMLLAGCASAPPTPKPRVVDDTFETPATTETATDLPAEKVAQAHAHYAAGVVHEMNDENEAALREYYLSAEADPDDEGLILEVTR